ncbi:MAG: 16S rRNA processing protein RimM [Armatimonadetes bacterium]|nr:16S rRNA processing protein RimM [Armatimonadota bacterium]
MTEPQRPDVTIGTVVAPFGIKGELKVRLETDFPERFDELVEVWIEPSDGRGRMIGVENVRFHQNGALVKFKGCDDRNCAEELRGAELRINREQLRELESDQFYVHDILGLDVYTTDGEHLGKITEVLQGAANDVYVTPRAMIPALKQVVREVDLANGRMVVEPIEGL